MKTKIELKNYSITIEENEEGKIDITVEKDEEIIEELHLDPSDDEGITNDETTSGNAENVDNVPAAPEGEEPLKAFGEEETAPAPEGEQPVTGNSETGNAEVAPEAATGNSEATEVVGEEESEEEDEEGIDKLESFSTFTKKLLKKEKAVKVNEAKKPIYKEYDMESMEDFYNYIAESHINGQFNQVKNLFSKLTREEQKACVKYVKNELGNSEVSEYLFDLM